MPPCPFNILEKSLIFVILFMYEKKISPTKKEVARIIENRTLYCKNIKINEDSIIEPNVPDQVLLGLIFGITKGPLKYLPIK